MNKRPRIQNVKLISIGNAKRVRLPKSILRKYGFVDTLLLEQTSEGILLRQLVNEKLSWQETYKQMAQEHENWQEFENTVLDGLEMDEITTQTI